MFCYTCKCPLSLHINLIKKFNLRIISQVKKISLQNNILIKSNTSIALVPLFVKSIAKKLLTHHDWSQI